MTPILALAVLGLVGLAAPGVSPGDGAALRYDLGWYDLSGATARDLDAFMLDIETEHARSGACETKTRVVFPCWRFNPSHVPASVVFVRPYPPMTEQMPGVQREIGKWAVPQTVWLEPAAVRGGAALYAAWQADAAAQRLYGCAASTCSTIVRGTLRPLGREVRSTAPEDALGECKITVIHAIRGAPSNCEPVAVVHDGSVLLQAVVEIDRKPPATRLTPPRDDVYVANTRMKAAQMATVVNRALAAAPLSLETEVQENVVVGNATFRVSPVDPRFHETATITAFVTASDRTAGAARTSKTFSYAVRFVTAFYVSPQNSERHEDLTYPPDTYEAAYVKALKQSIFAQLPASCAGSWQDADVILCR